MVTIATRYGRRYPAAALDRAWKHLLFNQFHDIICGTSIPRAYDDARYEQGEAIGTGKRTLHEAMQVIAHHIDTRSSDDVIVEEAMRRVRTGPGNAVADMGDGVPVVVFNPNPWPRREVVDVELNDWHVMDMQVLDDRNQPVVHQFAMGEAGPPRKRAAFLADVPALGYRVYRIVDRPPHVPGADARPLSATDRILENAWWRLELDPFTGALRSLRDKVMDRELLAGAGAQVLVIEDPSNPWGKGDYFRHLAGVFGEPHAELLEDGPVRATVRVTTRWGRSTARHDLSIYRDSPAIHGHLQLDWHEEYRMAKLAFPLPSKTPPPPSPCLLGTSHGRQAGRRNLHRRGWTFRAYLPVPAGRLRPTSSSSVIRRALWPSGPQARCLMASHYSTTASTRRGRSRRGSAAVHCAQPDLRRG